jgi:hypothetical protein
MKLTREEAEPVFRPITLTLETRADATIFANILASSASPLLSVAGLRANLVDMLNNPTINVITDAQRDRRYT